MIQAYQLHDPLAQMIENWCKHGSWAMCEKCGLMNPRPLDPKDLKKAAKPTVTAKTCTACKKKEYVPCLSDVPEPLRHLEPCVIEALRPLDIDTGSEIRAVHGYRVHASMINFKLCLGPQVCQEEDQSFAFSGGAPCCSTCP